MEIQGLGHCHGGIPSLRSEIMLFTDISRIAPDRLLLVVLGSYHGFGPLFKTEGDEMQSYDSPK